MAIGNQARIPLRGGAENDVYSVWRHWLCYMSRAGVKKGIRRGYNRRVRRQGRLSLRGEG